jgi:hypothetical protein
VLESDFPPALQLQAHVSGKNITLFLLAYSPSYLQEVAPLWKVLAQSKNLRKLHLCNNAISSLDSLHLDRADSLVELLLHGNAGLDDAAAKHLATCIPLNRRLVTLGLARCGISILRTFTLADVCCAAQEGKLALSTAVAGGYNYHLCSLILKDDDDGKSLTPEANAIMARNEQVRKVRTRRAGVVEQA